MGKCKIKTMARLLECHDTHEDSTPTSKSGLFHLLLLHSRLPSLTVLVALAFFWKLCPSLCGGSNFNVTSKSSCWNLNAAWKDGVVRSFSDELRKAALPTFCGCGKYHDQKQLKEGRGYFGLFLIDRVHNCKAVMPQWPPAAGNSLVTFSSTQRNQNRT